MALKNGIRHDKKSLQFSATAPQSDIRMRKGNRSAIGAEERDYMQKRKPWEYFDDIPEDENGEWEIPSLTLEEILEGIQAIRTAGVSEKMLEDYINLIFRNN